jgi:phospholipase C
MGDLLSSGFTWRYYAPSAGSIWTAPNAIQHICQSTGRGGKCDGQDWTANVDLKPAVGSSTTCDSNTGYWRNTAIFITWDDWGGWYDHEPPTILSQPQEDYQYGFRVPLIVVSAYTPSGYVNNDRHDFGSILRFVELNFSFAEGALSFADARAKSDLTALFDLTKHAREFQWIGAPKDANFFIHDRRAATDSDDQ